MGKSQDADEYRDVEFTVTITVPGGVGDPSEDAIKKAIYRGVEEINSEDAIDVQQI